MSQRTAALTELVDLAPTLLDAAGLDVPAGDQGRSLVPLLAGGATEHRADIYCEYYNAMPWHRDPTAQATMVRTARHKLALQHATGDWELPDVGKRLAGLRGVGCAVPLELGHHTRRAASGSLGVRRAEAVAVGHAHRRRGIRTAPQEAF